MSDSPHRRPAAPASSTAPAIPLRRPLLLAAVAFPAAALWLRLEGITGRGFEYDEIWTLSQYVGAGTVADIFTRLEVPNNHPLYSLAARLSCAIAGLSAVGLRLPALLAGLAVPVLMYAVARRLLRAPEAAWIAAGWAAFSAPLVYYSSTGRGYSLQAAILLAYGWAALRTAESGPVSRPAHAILALAPVLAVMTLPTSLVWVGWIGLAHALHCLHSAGGGKRPAGEPAEGDAPTASVFRRPEILAHAIAVASCAAWLAHAYPALRRAREAFGQDPGGVADLVGRFAETLGYAGAWVPFAAGVAALAWPATRRTAAWCLAGALLPFLLAPWLRAGPPRVYQPSLLFLLLAGTAGGVGALQALRERRIPRFVVGATLTLFALAPLVAFPAALRALTPTDWMAAYPEVESSFENRVCLVYPPGGGFPILFHHPDSPASVVRRRPREGGELALVDGGRRIPGMRAGSGDESFVAIPDGLAAIDERVAGLSVIRYALRRPDRDPLDAPVLAALGPFPPARATEMLDRLRAVGGPDRWLEVNAFLASGAGSPGSGTPDAFLLFVSEAGGLEARSLLEAERKAGGALRFLLLAPLRNPD